ncbi:hypothetical protein T459_19633 [Capsicum annuum]|uniref:Ubiquitin-like protease family profile domain-containing protein n=1 Tax=Capsicum annuum TaxID=4072 RepID=A0A2G2Z2I1_CAPAN|nr:hypothetical protein T459_19633 [Capsicum annuum]
MNAIFKDNGKVASSKTKKGKQTARVIFSQVQSKVDSYVEEVAVSKPESHVEKKAFISKKVFDAFCDEVHKEFKEIRHLVKKRFKRMLKAIEQSKQQYEGTDLEAQQMDYGGVETSPQQFNPTIDQNLGENQDATKFTIPNELLPSLNAYRRESIMTHPSATHEEEPSDEYFNDKKSESVVQNLCQENKENIGSSSKPDIHGEVDLGIQEQIMTTPKIQELTTDEQRDELVWHDSQNIIPDELFPSLNVYSSKRFIFHPSHEIQTPVQKLRIRSVHDIYSVDDANLTAGEQAAHLNEYINGFRMHVVVLWYTVEDIYISFNINEKHHWARSVLSFSERCIFLYDSYELSGVDVESHPKYKEKGSSDMFDVLFQENLPQQPSGSLDCGLYMVTYVEYLSYGHKVLANEFDPNVLRIRYAVLLWDYGTQKQDANIVIPCTFRSLKSFPRIAQFTDISHGLACGPSGSWAPCSILGTRFGALQTWYQSLSAQFIDIRDGFACGLLGSWASCSVPGLPGGLLNFGDSTISPSTLSGIIQSSLCDNG